MLEACMEETISIKELFSILRKKIWLIIVSTVISVTTGAILSFYIITPIYQTSTQLLVNHTSNPEARFNYGDIQTNLQLINTYSVIIKSSAILDLVRDELDLKITTNALNEKISVSSQQDSQVVNIVVQEENPNTAVLIANKTAEIFQREIIKIMNVDNVTILAKAEIGETPNQIKPQPILNIAISLVIGLMVGVGMVLLQEYLDNTIKSEQDIEKQLGLPIIGVVGLMNKNIGIEQKR